MIPAADLVCVAGGTGLAPLKAITEAVVGAAGQGTRRAVTLYVGVRRSATCTTCGTWRRSGSPTRR